MKTILLDTNSYSLYFAGDIKIKRAIDFSDKILLPVVVMGELYIGFIGGKKIEANKGEFRKFVSRKKVRVVSVTKSMAMRYAKISTKLGSRGTPIPTNDIWIAAQAIETNSTLVTYDKHFLNIRGLKVWRELIKSV